MRIGQAVLMRKPDNEATGGQNKGRYMKYGLLEGTITGIYPHHIVVQFENYKSSYRIVDINLGLEPYKEVANGNL
jgi:hypothetical protein